MDELDELDELELLLARLTRLPVVVESMMILRQIWGPIETERYILKCINPKAASEKVNLKMNKYQSPFKMVGFSRQTVRRQLSKTPIYRDTQR